MASEQYAKSWWLYVLKLEDGKWYVGITSKTPEKRFTEHKLGKRAANWTKEYKPIEIELAEDLGSVSREHAEEYEAKVTRTLMKERGLNNVRGGDLTDIDNYTIFAKKIHKKDDVDDAKCIMVLLVFMFILFAVSIVLSIDKYFITFIPGGVR